jgi:hypothetical protein
MCAHKESILCCAVYFHQQLTISIVYYDEKFNRVNNYKVDPIIQRLIEN